MIYRVFVEKKKGFDVASTKLKKEIENLIGENLEVFREILRYDIDGLKENQLTSAIENVLSEPPCDNVFIDVLPKSKLQILAVEYLPGQYDQRADSAASCIQLLTGENKPLVRSAKVFMFSQVKENSLDKIKHYLINPVEAREASMEKPTSLNISTDGNLESKKIVGFEKFTDAQVDEYHDKNDFAMTNLDLRFVRDNFAKWKRSPYETELKVIDTYWSDHCRHTTFLTELVDVELASENPDIKKTYQQYKEVFADLYKDRKDKYPCLMDVATIGAKVLKRDGYLPNIDVSEEINACSIKEKIKINEKKEEYLVMFKNETHNHPTEIEPFGGAATCLGGAIRDPLSGRAYVYQSMRITGCADPTVPYDQTMKGKLAQSVLTKTATKGFSSYGNQIGLATGIVNEIYHPNYVAKRLETGFVVASAKAKNVVREQPLAGDVVILLGGETGRDGCGGATGSSKSHTLKSVEKCGAEVQKGNPLTERKIQRLFRNGDVTKLIKRCNDFGAGGVCVAIGELADGLQINLDKVTKKYEGLTGTELAISESQERMAVVVAQKNADKFIDLCKEENLSANVVATVTEEKALKMYFKGEEIVNLPREFLDTNGVKQQFSAKICDKKTDFLSKANAQTQELYQNGDTKGAVLNEMSRLNVCSQKGMIEHFDSTIGARTVMLPLGGKKQLTPSISMAAKIENNTDTCTVASFGFNPYLMQESCYVGAQHSVIVSYNKLVASGVNPETIYFSFQEFFCKLAKDKSRWGLPLSALLGALKVQLGLKKAAIGGKDSMSGTFENIDVPSTLISFALGISDANDLITNVLTNQQQKLYHFKLKRDEFGNVDVDYAQKLALAIYKNIQSKNINFATIVDEGGIIASVTKSAISNEVGVKFVKKLGYLLKQSLGDYVIACSDIGLIDNYDFEYIGEVCNINGINVENTDISFEELQQAYTGKLEKVFPSVAESSGKAIYKPYVTKSALASEIKYAKPRVLIPIFAGTNCEYDTQIAFEKAGAIVDNIIIKNLSAQDIMDSTRVLAEKIKNSQIVMFPGGFSGGDEPDGSGKFIATTFRNQLISEQMNDLLKNRQGLVLGICNGFQAIIKLCLVPDGKIEKMLPSSATLTFNNISRHVSTIAKVKIASTASPWLTNVQIGEVYDVAVSHGEGRFVCDDIKKLTANGQIVTQYCDFDGNVTMESPFNPNGSQNAVEGICALNGRILGKMGHSERIGSNLYKNYDGNFDMKIFESGVRYFK